MRSAVIENISPSPLLPLLNPVINDLPPDFLDNSAQGAQSTRSKLRQFAGYADETYAATRTLWAPPERVISSSRATLDAHELTPDSINDKALVRAATEYIDDYPLPDRTAKERHVAQVVLYALNLRPAGSKALFGEASQKTAFERLARGAGYLAAKQDLGVTWPAVNDPRALLEQFCIRKHGQQTAQWLPILDDVWGLSPQPPKPLEWTLQRLTGGRIRLTEQGAQPDVIRRFIATLLIRYRDPPRKLKSPVPQDYDLNIYYFLRYLRGDKLIPSTLGSQCGAIQERYRRLIDTSAVFGVELLDIFGTQGIELAPPRRVKKTAGQVTTQPKNPPDAGEEPAYPPAHDYHLARRQEQAHCAKLPTDEPFFSLSEQRAAAICKLCPVRTECLGGELDNPSTEEVRGGITKEQRDAVPATAPDGSTWTKYLLRKKAEYGETFSQDVTSTPTTVDQVEQRTPAAARQPGCAELQGQ